MLTERLMADHIPVSNVAPPDRFYLAYFIFLLLGVGFLLPWNAFITAVDYFYLLYPTAHVATLFCVAYMFANLGTLILVLLYGQHVPSRTRIVHGFIAFTFLVLLVPALDALCAPGAAQNGGAAAANPAGSTSLALGLTLAAVAAAGAIDAVVQGSLFGMAGELHERYTQALAAGTSLSGIVVSVVRLLTKAVLPNTPSGLRLSAHLYFILSALLLVLCLLAFRRLHSLPVIHFLQSQVAALAEAERRAQEKARKQARRVGPGSGGAVPVGGAETDGKNELWYADGGKMDKEEVDEGDIEAEKDTADGVLDGIGDGDGDGDETLEPLVKREETLEEEQVIQQLLDIEDEGERWDRERERDREFKANPDAAAGAAGAVADGGVAAAAAAAGVGHEIAELNGERESGELLGGGVRHADGEGGGIDCSGDCTSQRRSHSHGHSHSHSHSTEKSKGGRRKWRHLLPFWNYLVSWWEHTFRSEEAMLAEGRAFSLHVTPIVDSTPSIYHQQWQVFQQIWPYAISLGLVYIVTLSMFPGFISELHSTALGSWYPILLIATYNLFDFFGKMAPVVFLVTDMKVLIALVLARGGFYVLYPLCVWWAPVWARHEVIIAAVTGAFGFSNGLLTSLLMMAAPNQVPRDRAESAGMVMVVFLVVGLFLGSLLSWARLGF